MSKPRPSRAEKRQLRLEAIGSRVRQYRSWKVPKTLQREIAERNGIGRSTWSRVENGQQKNLTVAELYEFADALGVHITDLLEDREPPTPSGTGHGSR